MFWRSLPNSFIYHLEQLCHKSINIYTSLYLTFCYLSHLLICRSIDIDVMMYLHCIRIHLKLRSYSPLMYLTKWPISSSSLLFSSVKEACLLLTLPTGSAKLLKEVLYQALHDPNVDRKAKVTDPVATLHEMGVYKLALDHCEWVLKLRTDL